VRSNTITCNETETLQLHLWQHRRCVAIVHFATKTSVVKNPNCNVVLRCNKKTLATTRWTTTQYPNATRPFASHGPRNNLVAIVAIATKYGILQHILCVALGGKSSSGATVSVDLCHRCGLEYLSHGFQTQGTIAAGAGLKVRPKSTCVPGPWISGSRYGA
jgi:hypothetical protein